MREDARGPLEVAVAYKTMLLHLNDELRAAKLMEAAFCLADDSAAHVIALYVMPSVAPPLGMSAFSGRAWIQKMLSSFREQGDRIKTAFEGRVKEHANLTYEWRFDESAYDENVAGAVINHARAADVVIVSQGVHNLWIDDVPERAAVESGRPVLVIPDEGEFRPFGREIAVAWKASREATRAVFDALPLLVKAKHVRLVTVKDASEATTGSNQALGTDLADCLLRYGIDAQTEAIAGGDMSVGESLLDYAGRRYQDMIVMGLYGHSRFREFLLGGVSRHILQHMTVPILFAH
jgi:nucleotide-binding universal stress UspA family protein